MTHKFTIQKNVPIPESRGRAAIYPFPKMEVGDSFEVSKGTYAAGQEPVRRAAYAYGRMTGKKFTCRSTGEDTLRIWRIA